MEKRGRSRSPAWNPDIGAWYAGDGTVRFRVWAPKRKKVSVRILSEKPHETYLKRGRNGYFKGVVNDVYPGERYLYRLDNDLLLPDPASLHQPEGIHGPSAVLDHSAFKWQDDTWRGIHINEMVIYEVHVGAFTPEGDFMSVIPRLGDLRKTGINAIELMPVAQFPGERNWGYDGVYPFAVQDSYGGPEGLKTLIDECHRKGMAVILDVVYNHLGPEGNYLAQYGYYFTDKYRTPWGDAVNFDGPYSDEVRHFFISNALYWISCYHIDGLRLDAIHGIFDFSAKHFLRELGEEVHRIGDLRHRKICVIPESDLNDVRVVKPLHEGGYGLDAQWNDDFHHALHRVVTGERGGYYVDFRGIEDLAKAYRSGFVLSGRYSRYRKRRHGSSSKDIPSSSFVVCAQNHDQIGNRLFGDRLSATQGLERLKLVAGIVIFSPNIPLLFMGEEYGETVPFQYFVSHSDEGLIEAVRRGRKEEFKAFEWTGNPPDPQDPGTFLRSKVDWEKRKKGNHGVLLRFYTELLRLRRTIQALSLSGCPEMRVEVDAGRMVMTIRRSVRGENNLFYSFNCSDADATFYAPLCKRRWKRVIDSAESRWGGPGSISPVIAVTGDPIGVRSSGVILYEEESK